MIPALKREKTVHAVDGAATVIGKEEHNPRLYNDNHLIIREVRSLHSHLLLKHRKNLTVFLDQNVSLEFYLRTELILGLQIQTGNSVFRSVFIAEYTRR
jgi:hypothetical protein